MHIYRRGNDPCWVMHVGGITLSRLVVADDAALARWTLRSAPDGVAQQPRGASPLSVDFDAADLHRLEEGVADEPSLCIA